jgi:hypothetical protein
VAKTVSKDIMIASASESNSPPFSITTGEAASQTFPKGWLVSNPGTGYVTGITSDTPISILGLVEQDMHNLAAATDKQLSVSFANADTVFAANVLAGSLADHVLDQSDLLTTMAIQRDTASTPNKIYLNSSVKAGANCRVFTLRTAQNTDLGDTNGRVEFVFLPKFAQSLGTS